ncbi:MAG: ABC transporter ATP-binding protein [Deltaproteobacteria bacterium]|nr:ABC transporter ATP-binding protein [Deltaproteobacteria bacterium]
MNQTEYPCIEVTGLTKNFGPIKAVDNISFKVSKGEVFGFLGPNGAGKSTTMKMITSFITPTSGSVSILGTNISEAPMAAKKKVGYLPESAALYPDMKVLDFLNFIRDIRQLEGKAPVERVVKLCALQSVLDQRIETLSKGFKRRVALAQAIIHDPEVLIMDEPTDGLDPNQKAGVRKLIKEMAKDKIIILSTHILEEVEALCTRAVVISEGKIRFDGTPDEFRMQSKKHNAVTIKLHSKAEDDHLTKLLSFPGVEETEKTDEKTITVYPRAKQNISHEVILFANENGWDIDEVSLSQGDMNEVFRTITEGGRA